MRQRAVLILRDVVQFSAAEVAELLETTPAAVNSSLQRARAHLAEVSPTEESVAEPDDAERRELLDRYCAAFENADMAALTELLQADVKLEMPPLPMWFTGRDAVMRFLAARAFAEAGDMVIDPDGRQRAARRCRVPAQRRPRHAGPFHPRPHRVRQRGRGDRRPHRLSRSGAVYCVRFAAKPVSLLTLQRSHPLASDRTSRVTTVNRRHRTANLCACR